MGFPDETDEDFNDTMEFLKKCAFSQVHIFPYSRREGTVADKMEHQVTNNIKKERAHIAKLITDKTKQDFLEENIGQILPVLFETKQDKYWEGHSDTYITVLAEGDDLRGLVKNVKILSKQGEKLVGVIL